MPTSTWFLAVQLLQACHLRRGIARGLVVLASLFLLASSFFIDTTFAQKSAEQYPEYHGATEEISAAHGQYGGYSRYAQHDADSKRYTPEYSKDGTYRQPVSLISLPNSEVLVSAKLAGAVFRVETSTGKTESVWSEPGVSLGDIVAIDGSTFAVAEQSKSQVLVLQANDTRALSVIGRLDAPGKIKAVAWDSSDRTLYASGKWSQRLYKWSFTPGRLALGSCSEAKTEFADLPMCGGQILVLPKNDLVLVVDPFGRDYVFVDRSTFEIRKHAQLYGHNIAGMAATADEEMIYFPHQLLNEYARSVTTDITWGGLMSNNIRWLRLERMLNESDDQIFRKGKFYPLGTPGNGAGDPSSMAVSSTGRIAITLGGTNRIAIGNQDDYYFRQVDVGFRPVDVCYSADEKQLYVANQFSDSVSVIDLDVNDEKYAVRHSVRHISLGDLRPPTEVELGEQLFFNSRISHDGWMSCHSCHSEGHTNGQLNDNFTDETFGTPKRILTLLGQASTAPYAWGGKMKELESQVGHSVVSTMAGKPIPEASVGAIAAYVRSLESPPSVLDARGVPAGEQAYGKLVKRGQRIFKKQGCNQCHAGEAFTSPDTYDVGLEDEDEMRLFNPPSLVAISQRANSLLHDGRAKSIRDVVVEQQHQLPEPLTDKQVEALVAYLESL